MKVIGVIPARYKSTRFPGKPLADICGKPMIWWVYQQVSKVKGLEKVFVATDDSRITAICEEYSIPFVMTRDNHVNHVTRLQEVSEKVEADYYVCVNGDEPLILPENIINVLPDKLIKDEVYAGYLMRNLTDPAETLDPSNIKLSVLSNGKCIYMSRMPIPYPKGTLNVTYKKLIGVECFNKLALDFYVNTPMGELEKIEDIDHLRFIENGKNIVIKLTDSESLSVDTHNDLEKVRKIMAEKLSSTGK
jgi:3-deoxy-manno-octulosonate cytidylyltransferase (CMP-KDO synthetase)